MTGGIREFVKSQHGTKSGAEILQEPPHVLLGVTAKAAEVLQKRLDIHSVFDLAYSQVFGTARTLVEAVDGLHVFQEFGRPPSDLVDNGVVDLQNLPNESLEALRGIGEESATELKSALDVETIRDLAVWPPHVAARRIAQETMLPETLPGFDPEAPADLLPRTGDYPTERVTYKSLVLDRLVSVRDPEPPRPDVERPRTPRPDLEGPRPPRTHVVRSRTPSLHVEDPFADTDVEPGPRDLEGAADRLIASDSAIDLLTGGPLRVSDLDIAEEALPLAQGALLTFSQSWYTQGLTLGQLLHSIALAPGETTRIAMIDWSRRTSASQTERIDQAEDLSNTMAHARAITEVTNAVANETQNGKSGTKSESTATEVGVAGATLVPYVGGIVAGSYGRSDVSSEGWGWSTTTGSRDITADMSQQINESTQQAATSARTRRASIVREVSQEESERVTTRAISNFNHMHALSVHYYEVVQLYRTLLQLERAERCLFVPIAPVDFKNPALIFRFREALASVALDSRLPGLLAGDPNDVAITAKVLSPNEGNSSPWDSSTCEIASGILRYPVGPSPAGTIHVPPNTTFDPANGDVQLDAAQALSVTGVLRNGGQWGWNSMEDPPTPPVRLANLRRLEIKALLPLQDDASEEGSDEETNVTTLEVSARVSLIKDSDRNTVRAPGDPTLTSAFSFYINDSEQAAPKEPAPGYHGTRSAATVTIPAIPLASIEKIAIHNHDVDKLRLDDLTIKAKVGDVWRDIYWKQTVEVDTKGRYADLIDASDSTPEPEKKKEPAPKQVSFTLIFESGNARVVFKAATVDVDRDGRATLSLDLLHPFSEVRDHLNAHTSHYSSAVWRSLSPTRLSSLLSRFQLNGKPVLEQVEPTPLAVTEGYVVLKWPVDDNDAWAKWQQQHHIRVGERREDLVPIPSGGVFGEAVLGRFNSAEKLDMTRFWNWQDSPIPITAPDIAAINTGSRGTSESLTAGQLDSPIVNIVNPSSLPDPSFAATLGALGQSNLFRDMSGLAQVAGLAQSGQQAAAAGARHAAEQAGANLETYVDLLKTVAALAMGVPPMPGGGGRPRSPSEAGALMNTGAAMDAQANGAGGSTVVPIGSGTSKPSSSGGGEFASYDGGGGNSHEVDAFRTAGLGLSPPPLIDAPPPKKARGPIKTTPAKKGLAIMLVAKYEDGTPFEGDFEFNLTGPEGQAFTFGTAVQKGRGGYTPDVPLTPGKWIFGGRVHRTSLPDALAMEASLELPGPIPDVSIPLAKHLTGANHFLHQGWVDVTKGAKTISLQSTVALKTVPFNWEADISASVTPGLSVDAQISRDVQLGIEGGLKFLIKGLASANVGVGTLLKISPTIQGTLGLNGKVSGTFEFSKILSITTVQMP